MEKRLALTRSEVTTRLKQVAESGSYDEVKKMREVIEGITCPLLPYDGPAEPLTARQYACFSTSISRIRAGDKREAIWQIYDFVTGKDSCIMNFVELQALCLLLEAFTWM